MIDWDRRFVDLASHVSLWSKDPSTQVGAVIVRPDRTIASLGFNGFPRGVDDSPHLYSDRNTKYDRVIHAEMNALLFLKEPGQGMTMYCWPGTPCIRCAAHVIQAGIRRVVSVPCDNPRWVESIKLGKNLFKEAGIEVTEMAPLSQEEPSRLRSPVLFSGRD